MTTKNCANGLKLVLKTCAKSLVRNVLYSSIVLGPKSALENGNLTNGLKKYISYPEVTL